MFKGHKNEKNFVGLSVNNEYLACGSETNEVYVYHKVCHYPSVCTRLPYELFRDCLILLWISGTRKHPKLQIGLDLDQCSDI